MVVSYNQRPDNGISELNYRVLEVERPSLNDYVCLGELSSSTPSHRILSTLPFYVWAFSTIHILSKGKYFRQGRSRSILLFVRSWTA